ncbi:hypothetical protein BH09MYX1_BH09MYX1_49750 [soil metagenome]
MADLFAPLCSITSTQRRRFFWAVWWSGPPTQIPFRKPDAEGGGATTREEALAAAEAHAKMKLVVVDALWARAWMRILRGQAPWPSKASRESQGAPRADGVPSPDSIWGILGITRDATMDDLKAAYRKRARETHPDHGGSAEAFQRVLRAHREAKARLSKPRSKRSK